MAKSALAFLSAFVGLLVLEMSIRILRWAPDVKAIQLGSQQCVYRRSTNPILGFELKPNYRHSSPDFIQSYERTNSHGLRDKQRTVEKPPGVFRVLLLGDSVVEGYGLPEHETISSQLEALYADGAIEVLNFGVSAYCTLAEIELLEVKGLRFNPDVVILVFVENDFDNFNREAFPLGGTLDRPAVVEALFSRSHLFRLTCFQWDLFQFAAEMDPVQWNKQAIGDNNVVEGLKRLAQLAEEHGFQPLIAIWPRFLDDRITDVVFMPQSEDLVIERLAASHGIPSVRLSTYFQWFHSSTSGQANPRLRYTTGDELHPSAKGCQVAAMALKEILTNLSASDIQPDSQIGKAPRADELAAEVAKKLGASKPSYSRVYNRLGVELLREGKPSEAAAQFKKAIQAEPNHAGAHNNLGIAYERLGLDDAEAEYKQAIICEPDFVHAHFNLARLLLEKGRTTAAIAGFERTILLDPNHVAALNKLGRELGKFKKLAEAQAHLERALQIDPDHSEVHNNLGVIHAARGQLRKAVHEFQEALRSDPSNAEARKNLTKLRSLLKE